MVNTGSILHIVPLNTGGVDRFVRDFCAVREQDEILHVGDVNVVLERVARREHWIAAAKPDVIATLYRSREFPCVLYAHSTLDPVRRTALALASEFSAPYVLSLHDTDFVARDVAASEREARHEFVRSAVARIAPSEFIAREARAELGVHAFVVDNGHRTVVRQMPADVEQIHVPGKFDIVVVGALGEHKGLSFLRDVASCLPEDARILHVGYSDGKLEPGWLVEQRIWSTGVFEPERLPEIVRAAGARIAFFPNRQAESFSYALSDVWLAGVPALVPLAGALGDRVLRTGAGWGYELNATEAVVARHIVTCLRDAESKTAAVRSAVASIVPIEQTVQSIVECFAHFRGADDRVDSHESLRAAVMNSEKDWAVASQLDTQLMRREIRKLIGELEFSRANSSNLEFSIRELSAQYEGRGKWISKLENDLVTTIAAATADRKQQENEIERLANTLANEHAESVRLQEKYDADIASLQSVVQKYDSAIARTVYPFRPLLRRWMNRK